MWAFCQVCFCCPAFLHTGLPVSSTVLGFLCVQLPPWGVGLLLCLVSASQGPGWGCFSQVKSEKQHQRCQGSVQFSWFCLTAAKIWSNGWTSVTAQCYSSVIAQFYLASKGKYILKVWGQTWGQAHPNEAKRREEKPEAQFWILFLMWFFSSPRACPL